MSEEKSVDFEKEDVAELFSKLDFKKLFVGMMKISSSIVGEDGAEDWTAEKRESSLNVFSDFFDSLQAEIPDLDTAQAKQGLVEAVEELHPTDEV